MTDPTLEELAEHHKSMIRVKLRAGLVEHPDWPPPTYLPDANKVLRLYRLAEEICRELIARGPGSQ